MMTTRDYKVAFILISIIIRLLSTPLNIYALPEGEQVIAGSATFDRSSCDTLNVNTPSDKLIVDYNTFSIAQTETVNFNQPSSSAVVLNRVVGVDPSSIMGTLTANGNVFLVNPNGVIFGKDSRVDVAGLVASTLNISNENFLKGNYRFFKDKSNAYIINQGNITVKNGGYVCLLSQAVENTGSIKADLGTAVLASGEKITLALDDLNEISVVVDEGVKEAVFGPDGKRLDSTVKNTGTISANGGKVILTAKVLNNVFDYAINNSGIIEAKSLSSHNGKVELVAEGAPILNTGTINANTVIINAINTDFINKGKIISDTAPATLSIKALNIINSGIISVPTSITLEAENAIIQLNPSTVDQNSTNNQTPQAIIQSSQINLKAGQFGTPDVPLYIIGNNIYISKSQGDIEILDSLGIGTSILLRGPPDGFGAIVYNKDTNLTLEAISGGINTSSGATILANNLSLIASKDINIYGNIYAITGSINVESTDNGAIRVYSTVSASNGTIRLWTSTTLDIGYSNLISKDGSFIWNPEDEVAVTWDSGAGTNNWEDANNWNPNGVPNNNSYRVTLDKTGGSALTVNTAADYTIGALSIGTGGNKNVTLNLGGNLTIDDADPTVTGAGNLTIGTRGTIDANSYTISVDGNWSNSGTFTAGTSTVNFTKGSGTQTLDSGGTGAGNSFYNLTHSGAGALQLITSNLEVNSNFLNSGGTFNTNSRNVNIAGNFTLNAGTTFTKGGTLTFDGTGSLTDNTASLQDIGSVSISNNSTRTQTTAIKMTGLTIASGSTYDIAGYNFSFSSAAAVSNSGTFKLKGNETLTNVNNLDTNSGTVVYYGRDISESLTIKDFGATDYNNLTINDPNTNKATYVLGANLTVGNNLTLTSGTFYTGGKNLTVSGTFSNNATLRAQGAETLSLNMDTNSGIVEYVGDGDGNQDTFTLEETGGTDFYNLIINSTDANDIFSFGASAKRTNNNLTLTSGILYTNGKNLTVDNTFSNDATLRLQGAETLTLTMDTNSGTFEYVGDDDSAADTFTMKDFGGTDYFNLTINTTDSSDVIQSAGAKSIAGTFTISSGIYNANGQTTTVTGLTTVNGGTYQAQTAMQTFNGGLTVSAGTFTGSTGTVDVNGDVTISGTGTLTAPTGTFTVSGNWAKTGSTFTPGTGMVTFDGTSAGKSITSGGASFNNITFNGAGGIWTLQDDLDINGNLTLTNGTLNLNGKTIALAGNFANNATFNHGSGTVIFDGAGISTISGSTAFFNLRSTAAGKQINFTAGTSQTITGTLTLTGSAGNLIVLRSSINSNQWNIDPQGTRNISYVDVRDSSNTNATAISVANSTDSGNNTNWIFTGPAAYLKITGASATPTAGSNNELTITAYDANGNTAISYTGTKSLTFSGLSNAPNGTIPTIEGVNIGTSVNISFTDGVSNAGAATLTAYKAESVSLDVTDGTIDSNGNASYELDLTVNPGAANNLNFIQQPTNTLVNSTITPSVTVEVRDTWNNILTDDDTTDITASISTNPGTGTLSGTLTKTASGGQATFNGLSINKAGTGYVLRVSSGALTSANSNAFDIALGAVVLESQSSNVLILRVLLPNSQQVLQYQINTFEPIGSVYLYHPLVEADISAFDAFILEEGAYEFIEGTLNITGHEGLQPLLNWLNFIKKK